LESSPISAGDVDQGLKRFNTIPLTKFRSRIVAFRDGGPQSETEGIHTNRSDVVT